MCQHRLYSYTNCEHSTILILREVAFCVKVLIYDKSKISFKIKTIFSEIYPYKNGQKVQAFGAIELNLTY